jgi:hypothetical protein
MSYKVLTILGSVIMMGFGIWHFFVPTIWKWYSYIDPMATELVLAVRATNFFFSLSLVLIGAFNIVLVSNPQTSRNAIVALLVVNIILWSARVALQTVSPQGTMNAYIQYGMTGSFWLVLILFISALILYIKH